MLKGAVPFRLAILLLLFAPVVYAQSPGKAATVEPVSTTNAAVKTPLGNCLRFARRS